MQQIKFLFCRLEKEKKLQEIQHSIEIDLKEREEILNKDKQNRSQQLQDARQEEKRLQMKEIRENITQELDDLKQKLQNEKEEVKYNVLLSQKSILFGNL